MGKILDGFPWWSQLTDIDPRTRRADVYAATDCGEEVASIWIAGMTGKYTDAADLRRGLSGPRADGTTSGGDVVAMLGTHGINTVSEQMAVPGIQGAVRSEIGQGWPMAVLGYWLSPVLLHWLLALGFGNDALVAMEPWSGRLVAYRWGVVRSVATGELVRKRR